MQYLIGALEMANSRNIASPYTLAYKARVLDQVAAAVNSIGNTHSGEPMAGGLGHATYDMLLQLNFKDVQPAVYNGKHFQQVWVGADFVLVPQEHQTSWPISAKTGLRRVEPSAGTEKRNLVPGVRRRKACWSPPGQVILAIGSGLRLLPRHLAIRAAARAMSRVAVVRRVS